MQRDDQTESKAMTQLTVRAAAERLGVGYSTLKRWVLSGRVRTTQTAGGHHRIAEAEIDRLLARHAPDTGAPSRPRVDDESIADLSARNRLHGYIEEVRVDGLLAQIRMRVGDQTITAVVTSDAVRALKFKRGDDAIAIVKSTEVMVARSRTASDALKTATKAPRRKPRP
ncbi:MAG: TOBE domain-containing protein [Vicinamibacterales bacterium]